MNTKTQKFNPHRRECISFLRQFILYLENSHTLYETWQICRTLFENNKKFSFISHICARIEEGHSWKTSMQSVFSLQSELYNLSWAKDQDGLLQCAQHTLNNILRSQAFFQKLVGSLLYPSMVLLTVICTIVVYHSIIKPRFFTFIPVDTNWNYVLLPFVFAGIFFFALFLIFYLYMNPFKRSANVSVLKYFPFLFNISYLRTWELILLHLNIHVSSGFTLWDAISSMRMSYGNSHAISQLGIIQKSLFESSNLQRSVLRNKNIPKCIQAVLYSSLVCNKISENISVMQIILATEIKQIISRVSTAASPISIALSGWAVLGICLDLLIPIHEFLGGTLL